MQSTMTQRYRFALWPPYRFGLWSGGLLLAAGLSLTLGACAPAVVGAGAAVGVTAAQERGFKGALTDAEIRLDINHLWFQKSTSLYSKVNLQVQEGRVLLTGNAQGQYYAFGYELTQQVGGNFQPANVGNDTF